MKRILLLLGGLLCLGPLARLQPAVPPPADQATRFVALHAQGTQQAALGIREVWAFSQQATPAPAAPPSTAGPEFFRAADEVLQEMSNLLSLPIEKPLKKSIRTRNEIRDYVVQEMKEDKEPEKRYADEKALEAFGLVPPEFDLDHFMVDLLTEQIAGLYDPKAGEFYIADWIPASEQRIVMAHELTHALDDQHFHIDAWLKSARPNDDAELARDAVLEGSAVAAMLDYALQEMKQSVPNGQNMKTSIRDLDDIEPLVHEAMGDTGKSPEMAKAPPFVRDSLVFPYLAGAGFTQKLLKAGTGWADFQKVFSEPPASTQQILHPQLYLAKIAPRPVALPDFRPLVPREWKKLDENVMGEFGLQEALKQFLGENRATKLSPLWAGDRYAIFEQQNSKQLMLLFRLRLESPEAAARFFGNYSEVLELKHPDRKELFRRPNYFQFATAHGSVFLHCVEDQCLALEGTDRKIFDQVNHALGWPAAPQLSDTNKEKQAARPNRDLPLVTAGR